MTDSAEQALGEGVQDNPKASVAALVALWAPQEWDLGVQGEGGAVCVSHSHFSVGLRTPVQRVLMANGNVGSVVPPPNKLGFSLWRREPLD